MTDALTTPRASDGRAPNVFSFDTEAHVPMRSYSNNDEVDFAIVGTGAGGGTLACKLAEAGFRVVAFDAGPFLRPLTEFASDETAQQKLYWTDQRITAGNDPLELGANNSGKTVGGSTVHFTMVSLRFRPDWFKSRSRLGYALDWPITYSDLAKYYAEAEDALKISGPVRYPWGAARGRYPYRPHEPNASGLVLARGCERMGYDWASAPLATVSAPRGKAHPCVYRGFCAIGCTTNAKQSALVTWIPRAIAAGAEIRDLATVGKVEMGNNGRAKGVVYHRDGVWHRQRARHVVVAGYSIETPRLLLNSATQAFPDGLANSSGLVGKGLMVHSNDGVYGTMEEQVRWYKGPPVMTLTEHWNYADDQKDFPGGYSFMSQGPLPIQWAKTVAENRAMWGHELRRYLMNYNHMAGFKIVGEVEPEDANHVELADEEDSLGLKVPRVVFSYSENDRRLKRHARRMMRETLQAAGGHDIWASDGTAHLMGGCRMGFNPATSVMNADGRTWDISNLWICDGSLFPTGGGVNPSLTIQALACRVGDRITELARRGEL